MNIKDLEYFYYLCQNKSFTKTAEILFVSQPSITMALHKIEKELGERLVIRDHSKAQLSLTEAGKILEKRAYNVLHEIKAAKLEISRISGAKIKLGVPPMIGAYFFPSFMKVLDINGLVNHIELVETGSTAMKKLLDSGEVDIALIGSIEPLKDNDLNTTILKTDQFMVCTSNSHPLLSKHEINFSELKDERFTVLGDSYIHNKVIKDLCLKNGIGMKDFYYTTEIQTAKSLIASGVGIGIMINMAVENMASIKTVSLVPAINFYISIAVKKEHYMTSIEKEIMGILLEK
ncbi:LysR family transcriptional regulator [Clostridium estertheticum]|uniref:LysR family transcriptional regulator n=1 Tax=Clostridium estertheticum TaxID=238834 RepID=UPI001C6E885A|nr:LysR family transcriptional regulator [Clostridium estertheticum]MBW9152436.1 LysR family transcriptional regulator [Clostridium estertheticum]WLC83954.1 LysR family transcriptional regulator [Clostridium estertheticum]